MKRTLICMLMAGILIITGCQMAGSGSGEGASGYTSISMEEARTMMDKEEDYQLVDVRTQEEYDTGHIPGAICIPNESIGDQQPADLANPDQTLLVYCRSGRRSKQAAEKLAGLGYSRVYEIGGINDWPGDIVTD